MKKITVDPEWSLDAEQSRAVRKRLCQTVSGCRESLELPQARVDHMFEWRSPFLFKNLINACYYGKKF